MEMNHLKTWIVLVVILFLICAYMGLRYHWLFYLESRGNYLEKENQWFVTEVYRLKREVAHCTKEKFDFIKDNNYLRGKKGATKGPKRP